MQAVTISQISPPELETLIENVLNRILTNSLSLHGKQQTDKQYVHGLSGLAQLIGCSHPTAQRLKNSGKIPYQQAGRKIVFDADAVLSALNKKG